MKVKKIFGLAAVANKLATAAEAVANAVAQVVSTVVNFVKKIISSVKKDNGAGAVVAAICGGVALGLLFGCGSGDVAMAMALIAGVAGSGTHTVDEPLTTAVADMASPGLLRNEIDDRIVKIRPMSTPLDQISRFGGARLCGSMKVEYYSVDTRPVTDTVKTAFTPDRDSSSSVTNLQVENPNVFDASTTLLVPSVKASDGGSLVLYVAERTPEYIKVLAVNNTDSSGRAVLPAIPKGAQLVRMGRAAAELDVQTAQFEALPKKDVNFCQIFKAQVEQSTYMKIANKEVGWTFSDQEEAAIIDMRMGMEKNFLFGHRCKITDPVKNEEILLTGGVWNQTDNTFRYSALNTEDALVDLCKRAFTNSAGSSRKVLIGGSGLIEQLHKIDHQRVLTADKSTTKWGLDFSEIHSKFGTLYVLLSEVFDQCGMPDAGMVIDPEYITKYSHVPFRTERLNLRQAGVRNTDAIVITEASCLVLRYPASHMRIVKTA